MKINELTPNLKAGRIFYKSEAFTGTAWSSDGKTFSVTCDSGLIVSVTAYHNNGIKAAVRDSVYPGGIMYDKNGRIISSDEFIKNYPDLVDAVASAMEELK